MNIEQTKEAIRVMQAFVDGKEVERCYRGIEGWDAVILPTWDWRACEYRIKPIPTLRPWTADEVPLGAWMREVSIQDYRWLMNTSGNDDTRKDWIVNCEHSIDKGVTWLPCGVMEEAK